MEMETFDNVGSQFDNVGSQPVEKSHEVDKTLKPSSPPTLPTSIRPGALPTSEKHLDKHSVQSPGALSSSVQSEAQKASEITQKSELPLPKAVSSSTAGHSSAVGDSRPLVQKFVKEVEILFKSYDAKTASLRIEELLNELPRDTHPEALKEALKAVIMNATKVQEYVAEYLIDILIKHGAQLTSIDKDEIESKIGKISPDVLYSISSKMMENLISTNISDKTTVEQFQFIEAQVKLIEPFFPAGVKGMKAIKDMLKDLPRQFNCADRTWKSNCLVQDALISKLIEIFNTKIDKLRPEDKSEFQESEFFTTDGQYLREVVTIGSFDQVVDYLLTIKLTEANVNGQDGSGRTLLMNAVNSGNTQFISALLARGANINMQDNEGKTALMFALEQKHIKIFSLLLASGADINLKDNDGRTALMLAESEAVVNVLIARGADINLQDNDGRTALMLLVGREEVVNALIARGADINLKDNDGRTALMLAESEEVVNVLIARGADINIQDNGGRTALMLAGSEEVVNALVAGGADINLRDNKGRTALMWAVKNENMETFSALLRMGADINMQDNKGRTALMWAVEKGNIPALQALLDKQGAGVNERDEALRLAELRLERLNKQEEHAKTLWALLKTPKEETPGDPAEENT